MCGEWSFSLFFIDFSLWFRYWVLEERKYCNCRWLDLFGFRTVPNIGPFCGREMLSSLGLLFLNWIWVGEVLTSHGQPWEGVVLKHAMLWPCPWVSCLPLGIGLYPRWIGGDAIGLPAPKPGTDICCCCRFSTLLFALVMRSLLSEVSLPWIGLLSEPRVLLASFFAPGRHEGLPTVGRQQGHCRIIDLEPIWTPPSPCHPTLCWPCWMFLEAEHQPSACGMCPQPAWGFQLLPTTSWPWAEAQGAQAALPSSSHLNVFFTLFLSPQKHSSLPPEARAARQAASWTADPAT